MRACVHACRCVHIFAGFHTETGGGGAGIPPIHSFPYPEILKLSMVIILAIYMLLNVSMCHQNVLKFWPRLRQKQSKRYIIFLGGACPQNPLVGMHAFHIHFAHTIILLPSYSLPPLPPNSKSCMKPWFVSFGSSLLSPTEYTLPPPSLCAGH